MLNKAQLRTNLKLAGDQAWVIKELIEEQSHYFLFPHTLQGSINVTEVGIKPGALDIKDYTYFSKVISGDHPVVETWQDSTYYIGEPRRYKFMQNEMRARKKYIVGQFYKGCLESDIQGLEIGSNESSGVMITNLQEHQSLVLYTTAKLEKEDLFKL